MGKAAEDLPLDPLSHTNPVRQDDSQDPRREAWYQFSTEVLALIASDQYTWAEDTLKGIQETVERTHHVTPGQRKAVENIQAARGRQDGFRRRYEGFRR